MKEAYETIEMDIREIPQEDVITVSGIGDEIQTFSMHDNSYVDFASFF